MFCCSLFFLCLSHFSSALFASYFQGETYAHDHTLYDFGIFTRETVTVECFFYFSVRVGFIFVGRSKIAMNSWPSGMDNFREKRSFIWVNDVKRQATTVNNFSYIIIQFETINLILFWILIHPWCGTWEENSMNFNFNKKNLLFT